MASIRTLKKDLNYLSYELLTEVFAYKHFHPDMEEAKFDEVIANLIKLRNEILGKINSAPAFESPSEQKLHYSSIHEGMVKLVEIVEALDK